MRAIQFSEYGDYDQLRLVELAQPQVGEGQVLVKMTAAAINPLDNTVRLGHFPIAQKPPLVPGNEGAGVVVEPGSSNFAVGTRVMFGGFYGATFDGTWREFVPAQAQDLIPIPPQVQDTEAAALPVAFLTAQMALAIVGGFKAGQSVLVPAVGGAVGNAAVQLARAQGASRVITSAGTSAKASHAHELGYADVIDLSQESLSDGVARLTDGAGVDIAIDSVGGPITGQALTALGKGGTLVVIGYPAGRETTINITDLLWKDTRILSLGFAVYTPENIGQSYSTILSLLADGLIKPIVARTFPLESAAEAQRHLIEDRPFGKVVLTFS